MAFQNAFDVGSCTVEVWDNQANQLYSGVMAKGDSHDFNNPLFERALTITVGVAGASSLSSTEDLAVGEGYNVYIFPSYSIGSSSIRIRAVSFSATANFGYGLTDPNGDFLNPFDSLSPASPDPMDLTQSTDAHLCWGIYSNRIA